MRRNWIGEPPFTKRIRQRWMPIDLEIFGELCGSPGYATTTRRFLSITSCSAPLLTQRSGVCLKPFYPVFLLIYRKRGHECIYFRGQL